MSEDEFADADKYVAIAEQRAKEARDPLDRFYTPLELTRVIAKRARLFAPMAGRFLEPSCGSGNFIVAMCEAWKLLGVGVDAIDLDPGARALVAPTHANFLERDFLKFAAQDEYDIIMGNPPFAKPPPVAEPGEKQRKRGEVVAQKHVEHMLRMLGVGGVCAVLLRSSFTSSKERYPLFERCPPILVQQVVERPSFTDDGETDQHEYSVFYWRRASRISFGEPGQTKLEWLTWKK